MNHAAFQSLPMVLETPIDRKDADGKTIEDKKIWAEEIKLLESLIGMDAESEEFRELEKELSEKGKEERTKFQGQAERKAVKVAKKGEKEKKGRRGKKKIETGDEESD
jgi:AP endonuclease 1